MCDTDDLVYASPWDVLTETRKVQHRFEVAMDQALEATGLSYAQYIALETVLDARVMHIAELARRLRVTRQAATETVRKLQRSGHVHVERDHRLAYVVPATSATVPLEMLRPFVADLVDGLGRHLPAHERGRLVTLLRRAADGLTPPTRPYWWLQPEPAEPR
jgi:DNA-binding MarR family transcriptional regulator